MLRHTCNTFDMYAPFACVVHVLMCSGFSCMHLWSDEQRTTLLCNKMELRNCDTFVQLPSSTGSISETRVHKRSSSGIHGAGLALNMP